MSQEQRFGEAIQALRKKQEWTLRRAAAAVRITHQRLAELEHGVARGTGNPTRPSRDVVHRMALAYGVPGDFLLELAGYARERPTMTDRDSLLLDLFHELDDEHQEMVVRVVRAIAWQNGPS